MDAGDEVGAVDEGGERGGGRVGREVEVGEQVQDGVGGGGARGPAGGVGAGTVDGGFAGRRVEEFGEPCAVGERKCRVS